MLKWLAALSLAVLRDPAVRRASRALLLAVLAAASAALGLGALLPALGLPSFGSSFNPLLLQ